MKVDVDDRKTLERIAESSLQTKLVSDIGKELASIVVDGLLLVREKNADGTYNVDLDNIKVEKKAGGSSSDTKLIKGIILDKEVSSPRHAKKN